MPKEILLERAPVTFALDATRSEFESGRFAGVASVFGSIVDTHPARTKFRPGAFRKTLEDRGSRVKILSQHNQGSIWIGLPTKLQETEEGLLLEASLNNTQGGRDASEALKHAARLNMLSAAELSIGFDALNFEMVEEEDGELIREITEARLWEVSLVNFGADRQTRITEAANLKTLLAGNRPKSLEQMRAEFAEAEKRFAGVANDVVEETTRRDDDAAVLLQLAADQANWRCGGPEWIS